MKKENPRILALTLCFVICSFIGWAYEIILTIAATGAYSDRGILHLPICPIYGFFSLAALFIFRKYKHPAYVFFMGAVLSSAFELICSYIIEAVLHRRLWDYSHWAMNFEGRISLFSSLIFGLLIMLPVKLIEPNVNRLCEKIGFWSQLAASAVIIAVIAADAASVLL